MREGFGRGQVGEFVNTRSETMSWARSPDMAPVVLLKGGSDTNPKEKTSIFRLSGNPAIVGFENLIDRRLCVLIFR